MRSCKRHTPVRLQHAALVQVILRLDARLLEELKPQCSQTWLPAICRYILQPQVISDVLKNSKIQQYCLRLRVSKASYWEIVFPGFSWLKTSRYKLLPAELDVSSTNCSAGLVVFCLYKPHVWKLTSLVLRKEKGILEKKNPYCYDFLPCVPAWSFETTGQIPAITTIRKTQKTAAYVKIPIFFPTLLTKQLLADTILVLGCKTSDRQNYWVSKKQHRQKLVKSREREKHGIRRKIKAWKSSYSVCPLAGGTPSEVRTPA